LLDNALESRRQDVCRELYRNVPELVRAAGGLVESGPVLIEHENVAFARSAAKKCIAIDDPHFPVLTVSPGKTGEVKRASMAWILVPLALPMSSAIARPAMPNVQRP
jgi:hypothetical protein